MKSLPLLLLGLVLCAPLGAAEPTRLELAHQAVKASQFSEALEQLRANLVMTAMQQLGNDTPQPAGAATADQALAKVNASIDEHFKKLTDDLDLLYAEIYTEPELKAIATFFGTPEGKAFLNKQPLASQRLNSLARTMRHEVEGKINGIIAEARAQEAAKVAPAITPAPTTEAPPAPAAKTPPATTK